jgi:hypothetical protein
LRKQEVVLRWKTPPHAPEVDPLDLELREYTASTFEKRYREASKIDRNEERENKRRKLMYPFCNQATIEIKQTWRITTRVLKTSKLCHNSRT